MGAKQWQQVDALAVHFVWVLQSAGSGSKFAMPVQPEREGAFTVQALDLGDEKRWQ